MVESVVRNVLKEGMKTWIVTTERVQAGLAHLREELDDALAEARYEYEHRAEAETHQRPEPAPEAEAIAPSRQVSPARSARAGTARSKPRTPKVAV